MLGMDGKEKKKKVKSKSAEFCTFYEGIINIFEQSAQYLDSYRRTQLLSTRKILTSATRVKWAKSRGFH